MSISESPRLIKRATLANYLPVLSLFIIFLPFIIEQIFTGKPGLELPWPGRQVIPNILFLRGNLLTDFFSGSTDNSVYVISAKILSAILPADTDKMLATYDTLQILLKYVVLWLSVILLVRFCCYLLISSQPSSKNKLTEIRLVLYIYFSFITGTVADNFVNAKALLLLRPAHVGDWDFPFYSLNPSGLSFFLVLLTLIPCYSIQHLEKPSGKNKFGTLAAIFLVYFIASIIHPVVPLFGLGLFMSSWLIFIRAEGMNNRWLRFFLIGSCAWVAAAICIQVMFPQAAIDPADFYRIYVEQRHPHHYLPSLYLKASFKLLALNFFILLGTIVLSIKYRRLRPIRTLALASIAVFSTINGIQYFFVEHLRLPSFTILGITRVAGLYEFLYSCVIATLFLFALEPLYRWTKELSPQKALHPRQSVRLWASSIWPGSLAVIIVIGVATGLHFEMAYASIPNCNERLLQAEFDKNSVPYPRQIIFDDEVWRKNAFNELREVGGFDVYSDYYFPFSTGKIIEWNNRRIAKASFLECLNQGNNPSSCHFRDPDGKPVYFVSFLAYKGMTPTFKADINGAEAYIYTL